MKAAFGANKEFKQCYGSPPIGQFALEAEPPKGVHWDHCREQFAAKFTESVTGFYFSHPKDKGEDVAAFIVTFESIVALNCSQNIPPLSLFGKTEKDTILWMQPSRFWTECYMKRSLLTALLRCGMNYSVQKNNFDEALFSEQFKETVYLRETKPAVLRFMFGFTKYVGPVTYSTSTGPYASICKHGWREEFKSLDNSTIRKRLVLPSESVSEPTIVGAESLWA